VPVAGPVTLVSGTHEHDVADQQAGLARLDDRDPHALEAPGHAIRSREAWDRSPAPGRGCPRGRACPPGRHGDHCARPRSRPPAGPPSVSSSASMCASPWTDPCRRHKELRRVFGTIDRRAEQPRARPAASRARSGRSTWFSTGTVTSAASTVAQRTAGRAVRRRRGHRRSDQDASAGGAVALTGSRPRSSS
jgi:hypothetical protein